jgi:hypothetical protein
VPFGLLAGLGFGEAQGATPGSVAQATLDHRHIIRDLSISRRTLRATGPSATCMDRHAHERPLAISGSVTAKRVLRARASHVRCQLAGFPDGDQSVAVWGSKGSRLSLLLLLLLLEPIQPPSGSRRCQFTDEEDDHQPKQCQRNKYGHGHTSHDGHLLAHSSCQP